MFALFYSRMETGDGESSGKRQKFNCDFSLCIICQKSSKKPCTHNPKFESFENPRRYTCERARVDVNDESIHCLLKVLSTKDLIENKAFYHHDCYIDIVNERNLKRATRRFNKARIQLDATLVSPKRGRPTSIRTSPTQDSESNDVPLLQLRSSSTPYNSYCIFYPI